MIRLLLFFLRLFCKREFLKLQNQLSHPTETQEQTKKEILALVGKKSNILEFESRFPIQSYEEYLSSDVKVNEGQIVFYETTSGSSARKKQIPYTKELIASFTSMFKIRVYDILANGPKLASAKLYFSVSPQFIEDENKDVRTDDDFIAGPMKWILSYFSVAPKSLAKVKDPNSFFHILSLYLIAESRLEIISIWSPSFLIELLKYIQKNKSLLVADLTRGFSTYEDQHFKFKPIKPQRIAKIKAHDFEPKILFPSLKIISCWGGKNAKGPLDELRKLFSGVVIQEKGLLATEGPFSLPLIKTNSQVPLPGEVYYEFYEPSSGKIQKIDQIENGKTYELIISQKSGLIRYKMNDLVTVTGRYKNSPCFEFCGRSGVFSDLVGEKLSEQFVSDLFKEIHHVGYAALIPVREEQRRAHYLLIANGPIDRDQAEKKLHQNPHYANARKLNQLGELEVISHFEIEKFVSDFYYLHRGLAYGDQKTQILHHRESSGELARYLQLKTE